MSGKTIDVEKIAEAVLYEGYLLFPYRRSSLKNQQRWTFGGVYPRRYRETTGGDDPWRMQTQCLVLGDGDTRLDIKIRFLHVIERKVAESVSGNQRFVEALRVGGHTYQPWEEAKERTCYLKETPDAPPLHLRDLLAEGRTFPIDISAGSEEEALHNPDGEIVGVVLRTWNFLQGEVAVKAEALGPQTKQDAEQRQGKTLYRVTVTITNITPWPADGAETLARNETVRQTFISTHTILRMQDGEFVSLLEPQDVYQQAAGECENIKTWPVLVGEPGERDTMLSSPIILYDYPQISPESQGNFFDATEIDELLTLGVMTLTDAEKQEMRESDAHASAILERTELLSEEQIMKLHGVVRYLQPTRREEV